MNTINDRWKKNFRNSLISVDNIFAVCGFGTNKSITLSVIKVLKVLTVTANNILNSIYSTQYVPYTIKIFFFLKSRGNTAYTYNRFVGKELEMVFAQWTIRVHIKTRMNRIILVSASLPKDPAHYCHDGCFRRIGDRNENNNN